MRVSKANPFNISYFSGNSSSKTRLIIIVVCRGLLQE